MNIFHKISILFAVGILLSHCNILNAQSKYFHKQYAWDANQNGNDLIIKDSSIVICGGALSANTLKFDSFILEIDQLGNFITVNNHLETNRETIYRKILEIEDQFKVFGSSYYYNYEIIDNLENEIQIVDINTDFDIVNQISTGGNLDIDEVIQVNGNYVIVGFRTYPGTSPSYWEPYIAMMDQNNNVIWDLLIEGYENLNGINDVAYNPMSNTLFCSGTVGSVGNFADVLFLEVSMEGDILQEKIEFDIAQNFGGEIFVDEGGLIETNHYIVNTFRYSKLLKKDFQGNLIWQSSSNETGSFAKLAIGKDGYFVCGTKLINESLDALLAKYNKDGELLWTRYFGGPGNDYGYALKLDKDESIYITGRTESNTDGADVLLIKTNCLGYLTEPVAEFDFEIQNETQVSFSNNSQNMYLTTPGGGGHFLWDFGDGNSSTAYNPNHIYDTAGAYEVTLKAIVCKDTAVYKTCVYLDDNSICCADGLEQPIPDFSYEIGLDSLNISFSNESQNLYQEYSNGAELLWNFGDGNFSTEINPVHNYEFPGYYEVSLSSIFCNDSLSAAKSLAVGIPLALGNISRKKIKLSPNPAFTMVSFSFPFFNQHEILLIFDAFGRVKHQQQIDAFTTELIVPLNDFSPGMYFWSIGEESGKLVVGG